MRELRNSLKLSGEQLYAFWAWYPEPWTPPFSRAECWTKDAQWNEKACGAWAWELKDNRQALAQADSAGQTRAR
jgi:hypothetical protein